MVNAVKFTKSMGIAILATLAVVMLQAPSVHAQSMSDKEQLDPAEVDKYVAPLIIPPAMPRTGKIKQKGAKNIEYYEIAVRQFEQQILPASFDKTTVWSYGSVQFPGTVAEGGSFNYPAFTIESKWQKPVRVKWINDLLDADGDYLSHLLPVDQTLHWANPVGTCKNGTSGTDCRGTDDTPYTGPVPIITHVHGADTSQWSDGYPEAWYLPDLTNNTRTTGIMYEQGTFYAKYAAEAQSADSTLAWGNGFATFQYPNDMLATTLWYHDHTLGMTRLNVYAGPAGFWLLRGGPGDQVLNLKGKAAILPGPAPALGDLPGMAYYEIPIVIQDRSFNVDGSLAYPDNRAFFEDINASPPPPYLDIPFIPAVAMDGHPSDVSAIWNPEFFGDMMVVNGRTWPFLNVENRRYRFRLLNGSDSRFLILKLVKATDPSDPGTWVDVAATPWTVTQIGSDGGFLAAPLDVGALARPGEMLLGPAERADVIVDFANIPLAAGEGLYLVNIAPDDPYGGGVPGDDFDVADPTSTGQVMRFNVAAATGRDNTTPAAELVLPAIVPLVPDPGPALRISLNELESETVCVVEDDHGNVVEADCNIGSPFGPTEAQLGTVGSDGYGIAKTWSDPITENPPVGSTATWEIYNYTADAHPIHIHLVQFQVLNRQLLATDADGNAIATPIGTPRGPEPWESGFKDTLIVYPGEMARVTAKFNSEGLYVWHCHILEHEDNEMMRPYCVTDTSGSVMADSACAKAGTEAPIVP